MTKTCIGISGKNRSAGSFRTLLSYANLNPSCKFIYKKIADIGRILNRETRISLSCIAL